LILVVAIGCGVYFGLSYLKSGSTKLVNTKLDNIALDIEEQTFIQNKKDLEKYKTLNETLVKILPKSKDQAQAVKELYQIGDETYITIEKVQFPTSTLGQKTTTQPTAGAKPVAGSSSAITQAKAVEGMPGVLGIDINVDLAPKSGKTISYDNMIKFLQKVESNRRSMQIKQINVHADPKNGGVTFDITLTIFIKP
jgi:hypothetical protein